MRRILTITAATVCSSSHPLRPRGRATRQVPDSQASRARSEHVEPGQRLFGWRLGVQEARAERQAQCTQAARAASTGEQHEICLAVRRRLLPGLSPTTRATRSTVGGPGAATAEALTDRMPWPSSHAHAASGPSTSVSFVRRRLSAGSGGFPAARM